MSKAAFIFGRFQPPTRGHQLLVDKMLEIKDADPYIFTSQKYDTDKNILKWNEKTLILKQVFPECRVSEDATTKTPYQALEALSKEYKDITFVVGADRLEGFQSMHKYAEEWGVEKFEIICAGWRDPTADNITGVSSTGARQAIIDDEQFKFLKLMPRGMKILDRIALFNKLQRRYQDTLNTLDRNTGEQSCQ